MIIIFSDENHGDLSKLCHVSKENENIQRQVITKFNFLRKTLGQDVKTISSAIKTIGVFTCDFLTPIFNLKLMRLGNKKKKQLKAELKCTSIFFK